MASKIHTHYPEHVDVAVGTDYLANLTFTAFSPESSDPQGDDRPDVHTVFLTRVDAAQIRDQLSQLLDHFGGPDAG